MQCSLCVKNQSRLKKVISIEVCRDCARDLEKYSRIDPPEDPLVDRLKPDGGRFLETLDSISCTMPRENAKMLLGICLVNVGDREMDDMAIVAFLIAARSFWMFGKDRGQQPIDDDDLHLILNLAMVVAISVTVSGVETDMPEEEALDISHKNLGKVLDDLVDIADEELKRFIFDINELSAGKPAYEKMEYEQPEDSVRRLRKSSKFDKVYQFRISIGDIEPEIWRRIQVPSNYTFWDLHIAIQDAFGWQDYHMHEFVMPNPESGKFARIGLPFEVIEPGTEPAVCWERWISDFFRPENPIAVYEYDFGDSWMHKVVLETVEDKKNGLHYPICTDGARAAPPEDCGGVGGYEDMLEALQKPKSTDAKEYADWLGYEYDPEEFNRDEVKFDDPKKRLRMLRK